MGYEPGNYLQSLFTMSANKISHGGFYQWIFIGRYYPEIHKEVNILDERKIKRYSIQLAMLKKLLLLKLISSEEYKRILKKLMNDYGIISNITT